MEPFKCELFFIGVFERWALTGLNSGPVRWRWSLTLPNKTRFLKELHQHISILL